MDLSLDEAAVKLGKSARQVRYQVQKGELPARKVAGRWVISSDKLPETAGQSQAAFRKEEALRDAVEKALAPDHPVGSRYSVHQLKAFQVALPLHRVAVARFGPEHVVPCSIADALRALSRGCHRFERNEKLDCYRLARDFVSVGVCELAMEGGPAAGSDKAPQDALAQALEQEVLPAIAGLLRRIERPRSR